MLKVAEAQWEGLKKMLSGDSRDFLQTQSSEENSDLT